MKNTPSCWLFVFLTIKLRFISCDISYSVQHLWTSKGSLNIRCKYTVEQVRDVQSIYLFVFYWYFCVFMRACARVWTGERKYVRVCMYVYICIWICISVCVYAECVCMCACVFMCLCIYVFMYLCIYVFVFVCLCVCVFVCICVYLCVICV